MDRYCYKVKVTCTFDFDIYASSDGEALQDAKHFRIEHNSEYQSVEDKAKKLEIVNKYFHS